jgi:hypothetical protein
MIHVTIDVGCTASEGLSDIVVVFWKHAEPVNGIPCTITIKAPTMNELDGSHVSKQGHCMDVDAC